MATDYMAIVNSYMTSPITWIGFSIFLLLCTGILVIILIVIAKKTHAVIEIKAWFGGKPIALFFSENRYCEWKAIKPEAGILQDPDYGAFIINEKATYVDKLTKAVLIPFDSNFAASLNVKAAKLIDDLQYLAKDEEEMKKLRIALANNMIDDSASINALKTSVYFGAIKTMMTALVPHNINAKIEKTIAARLKSYGNVNVPQIALLFVAVLGAILIGYILIKSVGGGGGSK
jgi:hypothetical protein